MNGDLRKARNTALQHERALQRTKPYSKFESSGTGLPVIPG